MFSTSDKGRQRENGCWTCTQQWWPTLLTHLIHVYKDQLAEKQTHYGCWSSSFCVSLSLYPFLFNQQHTTILAILFVCTAPCPASFAASIIIIGARHSIEWVLSLFVSFSFHLCTAIIEGAGWARREKKKARKKFIMKASLPKKAEEKKGREMCYQLLAAIGYSHWTRRTK